MASAVISTAGCSTSQVSRSTGPVDNLTRLRRKASVGGWRGEMPEALQRRFRDDFGAALALAGYPEV